MKHLCWQRWIIHRQWVQCLKERVSFLEACFYCGYTKGWGLRDTCLSWLQIIIYYDCPLQVEAEQTNIIYDMHTCVSHKHSVCRVCLITKQCWCCVVGAFRTKCTSRFLSVVSWTVNINLVSASTKMTPLWFPTQSANLQMITGDMKL